MASLASSLLPSPSSSSYLDPNPNPSYQFTTTKTPIFLSTPSLNLPRFKKSLRRCRNPRSDSSDAIGDDGGPTGGDGWGRRLDSLIQDMVKSAVKRWDDYMNSSYKQSKEEEFVESQNDKEKKQEVDWERWKRHFEEMEDQEIIVSVLKMQLSGAISREDYEDAAKLKLAISAAARNDSVGMAVSDLNRATEEERYKDAIFLRDHAGVGLVGWWAGISEDSANPYGRIIHISAEHGKYVARSYSSRQLATARPGFPLFEVYFTFRDGEYKQQAVYLKHKSGNSRGFPKKSVTRSDVNTLNQSDTSNQEQSDTHSDDVKSIEEQRNDDSDGLAGIKNILRDVIPGVKVKVLKVKSPGKVDRDMIANVIEQIMEEEDDEKDEDDEEELEGIEVEDGTTRSEIEADAGDTTEEQAEVSVEFVIWPVLQKKSSDVLPKDLIQVQATLDRRDRKSFLFSIEQDDSQRGTDEKEQVLQKSAPRSPELAMSDLAKVILSKEKIPMKVLKDVGELINHTMNQNQNQNHQSLSGSTLFSRIEQPTTSDPLSGLYVSVHGMHTSEILHLKHKFGQWQEDATKKPTDLEFYEYVEAFKLTGGFSVPASQWQEDAAKKPTDLEIYEYVEAFKLTGGLSVPAGEVAFRAKVGKRYQLPHKGIMPEELGVIAIYNGQGRVADPGFTNPRWVDGELVILSGKYIRGDPVIGFLYLAPEYKFMTFFNQLRLPD